MLSSPVMTASRNDVSRNCLITGASGHIGTNLLKLLKQKGWHVSALQHRTPLTADVDRLLHGDIAEFRGQWLDGVDVVFHLAARGGNRRARSAELQAINVHGTRMLVQALIECGRKPRLVYASSIDVYSPIDDGSGMLGSGSETEPRTEYGRTKLTAERSLAQWPNSVIVRFPMVVGNSDRHIKRFRRLARRRIFPVTDRRFCAIDVRDAVRLLLHTAVDPTSAGRVYTVSDGRVYTWKNLALLCGRLEGVRTWSPRIPTFALQPRLFRLLGNSDAALYLKYDWCCRPNFPEGFSAEHTALPELN